MKKKLLSILLAGAMAVSVLAGCGGASGGTAGGEAASGAGADAAAAGGAAAGSTASASGEMVLRFGCYGYADTLDPGRRGWQG